MLLYCCVVVCDMTLMSLLLTTCAVGGGGSLVGRVWAQMQELADRFKLNPEDVRLWLLRPSGKTYLKFESCISGEQLDLPWSQVLRDKGFKVGTIGFGLCVVVCSLSRFGS